MKILVTLGFLFFFTVTGFTQKAEKKEKIPYLERDSLYRIHSPRKALLLSAVAPGAGQIYNKKIWKAPIVWAGMGTCVGFIVYNTKVYNEYRDNFIALHDGDASTLDTSGLPPDVLQAEMNRFRKYKEISYIALAGVYVLNMLDAYVDGYLFHFDINQDLTAGIRPYSSFDRNNRLNLGLSVSINLK